MSPVSAPAVVAGRYALDRLIATGETAEIWSANDQQLSRAVAVKLLHTELAGDTEALRRFRVQACSTASVEHEGIVRVFDYDEPSTPDSDDRPYLVMEFVAGRSLADRLSAGPLPVAKTLHLLTQTAAALAAAHQAGLVHGAVSARNLLLTPDGLVKLIGFGSADPVAAAEPVAADDVYALGQICRQSLTGQLAQPESAEEALSGCPAPFAELIGELTAADPAQRLTDAAEVARRATALAPRPEPPPRPAPVPQTSAPVVPVPVVPEDDGGRAARSRAGSGPPSALIPAAAGGPQTAAMQRVWLPPALWEPRTRQPGKYLLGTAAVLATALAALAFVSAVRSNAGVPKTAGVTQPAMVRVDAAALAGQPVAQVQLRLRRLGLGVTLRWRITNHVRPGLVLAVSPAGLVRPHSQVTVTGSRWPASAPPGPVAPSHGSGTPHRARHTPKATPSPTDSSSPRPSPSPAPSSSPPPTSTAPPPSSTPPPTATPPPATSPPIPPATGPSPAGLDTGVR